MTAKRSRYPGINTFTREDEDIFCGRSDQPQKLFNRLMLNNTLVLHGRSGTGKSSLVQAGLIPLLEKYNAELIRLDKKDKPKYLPVTISFDSIHKSADSPDVNSENEKLLVRQILSAIDELKQYRALGLPYISPKEDSLWYIAKLFERNNYSLLLIFDQFEGLQACTYGEVEFFTRSLCDCFVSTMPDAIYKEYDKNTSDPARIRAMNPEDRSRYNLDIKFLEQSLKMHVLFIVREDMLGTMSLLSDYFPDILKNDYLLLPLDKEGARNAIVNPAAKDGEFLSQKFEFEEAAIEHLLQTLVDKGTGLYDPMQLQIVCGTIENRIAVKKKIITLDDLPAITDIIIDFYKDIWKEVKKKFSLSQESYDLKRKAIIEELVVAGRRNLVLEDLLIKNGDPVNRDVIAMLVAEGLLRKIPSGNDLFYQLSHDRLRAPLASDLQDLLAKENVQQEFLKQKEAARARRQKFLWVAASLLTLTTGIAIWLLIKVNNTRRERQEEQYMLISTSLKRAGNPTLGYLVSRDYERLNAVSSSMKEYLDSFNLSTDICLSGVYPSFGEIKDVAISGGNRLLISEDNHQAVWDMNADTLLERTAFPEDRPVQTIETPGGMLSLYRSSEGLLIRRADGSTAANIHLFFFPELPLPVSPDKRWILLDNAVYSLEHFTMIDLALPRVEKLTQEQPQQDKIQALTFLDRNRLAISYASGAIWIDTIDQTKTPSLQPLEQLSRPYNTNGTNFVGLMVFNDSLNMLLASNSQSTIELYDLSVLALPKTLGYSRQSLITELKGHTGPAKCLQLSSDKRLLLSGGSDNQAILWDLVRSEKIGLVRAPYNAQIKTLSFGDHDSTLIGMTDDGLVLVWRRDRPENLYNKGQLYRFSPFNYDVWGIQEIPPAKSLDMNSTAGLYRSTLRHILNIPAGSEYPDDKSYNQRLVKAIANINDQYRRLKAKKDYDHVITPANDALLDIYFNDLQAQEPALTNRHLEDDSFEKLLLNAKTDIGDWKLMLLDSSTQSATAAVLTERVSDRMKNQLGAQTVYANAQRLIAFYRDSLWRPLNLRYPGNESLKTLKNAIDILTLKYYLRTGKDSLAHALADTLTQTIPLSPDASPSLIASYVVSGHYAEAERFFQSILPSNPDKLKSGKFVYVLKQDLAYYREKHIGLADIDKFIKEFNLALPNL